MKAHYVIPVIILVGIVGSVIGWSAAQIVTGPDWPAVLATATFLLAMATMWIAWESRTSRREAAQRDREVAFRAALVELATNIQGVEAWDPSLESTPPEKWLQTPLAFAAAKNLLAHVWVPAALWDRITTLVTNLAAYVEVVTAQIRGLPPNLSESAVIGAVGPFATLRPQALDRVFFWDKFSESVWELWPRRHALLDHDGKHFLLHVNRLPEALKGMLRVGRRKVVRPTPRPPGPAAPPPAGGSSQHWFEDR